ncbi:Olfactory Receptor 5B12 [Manis pentadactyla]|nr:Olfactory Receptor 5B12 [Manis pentadactyla]
MHSAEGWRKAFSTCIARLTAVSIFYGTILFIPVAQIQPVCGHGQNHICVLHCGDSHVESLTLQPQEQRCEKCSLENSQRTLSTIFKYFEKSVSAIDSSEKLGEPRGYLGHPALDHYISEMIVFFVVGFNALFTVLVILTSYLFIFITILRMHSSEGRQKAFSTCASHLTTISIFYGTGIFMYLQPSSGRSVGIDKVASVFYTMVIPMLNPLVYSLRNREVKSGFKKAVGRAKCSIGFML